MLMFFFIGTILGRTLSALASSQISINPDIPEAHRLRGWYDTAGHSADYSEFRSDGQGPSGSGSIHFADGFL